MFHNLNDETMNQYDHGPVGTLAARQAGRGGAADPDGRHALSEKWRFWINEPISEKFQNRHNSLIINDLRIKKTMLKKRRRKNEPIYLVFTRI
jgi:hypothetical protein